MDKAVYGEKIGELLKSINIKIISKVSKHYEPYGLTPPQASVLLALNKDKEVKVSELGCMLNTPDSNISAICSRLEERGLIKRVRNDDDRRVVKITATPKAKKLFEEIKAEKCKMFSKFNAVDEGDIIQVISALEKLDKIISSIIEQDEVAK